MRILCMTAVALLLVAAPMGESNVAAGSGSIGSLILFSLVAIGFSFLCSVFEAVLLSVTPSYIAALRNEGKRAAANLEYLKENIDRPLAAILSLNTIAHTVGAAGVGAQAAGIWGNQAVGWASAVMTLLILVLSEIIPKTIGAVYWRALAPWVGRAVNFLIYSLYPLVLLSDLMTRMIAGEKQDIVTREEVAAMAELSEQGGHLESKESRILKNLFLLRSLTAHDIMTPRPVMIAFPEETTVGKLFEQQESLPVSRIPIYRDKIDRITGFILKMDLLLAHAQGKPETPLRDLRRDLRAVDMDASLSELLDVLLKESEHIALVVDEYGGTDGLVTMEDLIETLLGIEIVDEADEAIDMQRVARENWEKRARRLGLDVALVRDHDEKAETPVSGEEPPADSKPAPEGEQKS